jgi:hypothetical protein
MLIFSNIVLSMSISARILRKSALLGKKLMKRMR